MDLYTVALMHGILRILPFFLAFGYSKIETKRLYCKSFNLFQQTLIIDFLFFVIFAAWHGQHNPITATEKEAQELLAMGRSFKLESRHVQRAKIILLSIEGKTMGEIIQATGLSKPAVNKWRHRFRAEGIEGLRDAPGAESLPPLPRLKRQRPSKKPVKNRQGAIPIGPKNALPRKWG